MADSVTIILTTEQNDGWVKTVSLTHAQVGEVLRQVLGDDIADDYANPHVEWMPGSFIDRFARYLRPEPKPTVEVGKRYYHTATGETRTMLGEVPGRPEWLIIETRTNAVHTIRRSVADGWLADGTWVEVEEQ